MYIYIVSLCIPHFYSSKYMVKPEDATWVAKLKPTCHRSEIDAMSIEVALEIQEAAVEMLIDAQVINMMAFSRLYAKYEAELRKLKERHSVELSKLKERHSVELSKLKEDQ